MTRQWPLRDLRKRRSEDQTAAGDTRLSLQYVSDLHLEVVQSSYATFHIPTAPVRSANGDTQSRTLILAGDIGRIIDSGKLLEFLQRCSTEFDRVLYVLGNHEFYQSTHEATITAAQQLVESPLLEGRVSLLHRGRVDLDARVTVLGCTLWSKIPSQQEDEETQLWTEMKLADFRRIEGWTTTRHTEEHFIDLAWLKDSIEEIAANEPNRRIVVVAHHAPTADRTSNPKFEANRWNCGFRTGILESNDFRVWRGREQIEAWVFGHTHFCTDFMKESIRVVANQRGYVLPNGQMELQASMKDQVRPKASLLDCLRRKQSTRSVGQLEFDPSKTIIV